MAERSRRYGLALGLRAQMADQLIALGARLRPPMPDPIDENPGLPPRTGAEWIAGSWSWTGGEWRWTTGYWYGGEAVVTVDVGFGGRVGGGARVEVEPDRQPVVDHRPVEPPPERPRAIDHRPAASPPPPPPPAPPPAARDDGRPRVLDHRDDDDDQGRKGGRPRVRDHR